MSKKDLLIHQIPQIEVEGSTNIPTVILYETKDHLLIGSAAVMAAKHPQDLNCDFKVDLGNTDPIKKARQIFRTAEGGRKSAQTLTEDFLREVLSHTSKWLLRHGVESGTRVLLAEPLSMQSTPDWLANYRKALRQVLEKRRFADIENIEFASVDFLPEPFAVFQYYRYGYRHPLLVDQKRNQALVLDFGGGTLDVCIIETTKDGELSQSGRNSRPLAASSEPIGGFLINRKIVEHLFRQHIFMRSGSNTLVKHFVKGQALYAKWRSGETDRSTLSEEYQSYVQHFHDTVYQVEACKIGICRLITDWRLNANLSVRHQVRLPLNPFQADTGFFDATFTANELREIFVKEIWLALIRPLVEKTIERGQAELNGAPITVVLLSGGSANIGWLRELLVRDFPEALSNSEILQLPDYQEVVSKGLAVECARRFHSEAGDFAGVTYNRLCLVLNPNNQGTRLCVFKPLAEDIPMPVADGILLPSASLLKPFIGKPLHWKVYRLGARPKRLEYFFLRSSFDPSDLENLQNMEEHKTNAPTDSGFDSELKLELLVEADGTARPKFIYKTGRTEAETMSSVGRPFYLDMTYGQTAPTSHAYIGLDFGTSNTSVSFIDRKSIQVFERRSGEEGWGELSDFADTLPYPIAAPLAAFLSQVENEAMVKNAREFIEAALAMAAYVVYADYCANKGRAETSLFRGFTQRSAGPLWRFLRDCLDKLPATAEFSVDFKEVLKSELFKSIDDAVTFLSAEKHNKAHATNFDLLRPIQILANISQKVFSKTPICSFEQVSKPLLSSSYHGVVRAVHGQPPFLKTWKFQGPECFSEQEVYLVDHEKLRALRLSPLIFWMSCPKHQEMVCPAHCMIYDLPSFEKKSFSFKAVGYPCSFELRADGATPEVAQYLETMGKSDPKLELVKLIETKSP